MISDTEAQPLLVGSHLGSFGIVTVGRISNLDTLVKRALDSRQHFSETTGKGEISPTAVPPKWFPSLFVKKTLLIKGWPRRRN